MPNETQLKKATIKEVIRIKKTFDMCYQTQKPFHHQQNEHWTDGVFFYRLLKMYPRRPFA